MIYRAVVLLGYGKYVVDGFNSNYKQYLKKEMFHNFHAEEKCTENHMNAHTELKMVQEVFYWSLNG